MRADTGSASDSLQLWTNARGSDLMRRGIAGREHHMSSITVGRTAPPATDPSERSALLLWMIFTGLSIFAVILLWRYGLIHLMVTSDRTYISSVIAVLFIVTCGHCFF